MVLVAMLGPRVLARYSHKGRLSGSRPCPSGRATTPTIGLAVPCSHRKAIGIGYDLGQLGRAITHQTCASRDVVNTVVNPGIAGSVADIGKGVCVFRTWCPHQDSTRDQLIKRYRRESAVPYWWSKPRTESYPL